MTNKQFHFSLATAISLLVLGAMVAGQASVGLSLMGLGAAILSLSLVSRYRGRSTEQPALAAIAAPISTKLPQQAR